MVSKNAITLWALAACLLCVAVSAQEQRAPNREAAPQAQPGRTTVVANKIPTGETAQQTDQTIANLLAIANQKEITIAQIAQPKLEDKQARELADQVIKDHSKLLQDIQRFGGSGNFSTASGHSMSSTSGGLDIVEIERRVANKCVENAKKEWSQKHSSECDLGFVGMQAGAHQQMVECLQVLRDYASPQLQAVIDQGLQTSERHLEKSKELLHAMIKDETKEHQKDRR
jgi:predicted outer membrane protein